jgi:hypothetical protein
MVYLISKDFTTEVTREYEVQAVSEIIHYWNLSNRPSEYADGVEYLDDINFKVKEEVVSGRSHTFQQRMSLEISGLLSISSHASNQEIPPEKSYFPSNGLTL